MTNSKMTKRALLTSIMALMLCFAMLTGTTFAWFTDQETSANNKIIAGNLDVELYHQGADDAAAIKVDSATADLFQDVTPEKWEPGAIAYETFTIKNVGNLAFKYDFTMNVGNATVIDGHSFADMLKVTVVEGDFAPTGRIDTSEYTWTGFENLTKIGKLYPADYATDMTNYSTNDVYTIIVWWEPSDIDNVFNTKDTVSAEFRIQLFATQLDAEMDAFGPEYDVNAPMTDADAWDGTATEDIEANKNTAEKTLVIENAADLAAFRDEVNGGNAYSGWTVTLATDIDLLDKAWTPIGGGANRFGGTFDGAGHTVYNLNVDVDEQAGLFGAATGATIKNVNVVNATIKSNHFAGVVLAQGYANVENCSVDNAEVVCGPELIGTSYDNGDKAGILVGWMADYTISGNTVKNSSVTGYRDIGGIAGYADDENNDAFVFGNTVENCVITLDDTNAYSSVSKNASAIVGRNEIPEGDVHDNTDTNCEVTAKVSTDAKLDEAIKAGVTTVELGSGSYVIPVSAQGKTLTIVVNGESVVATNTSGSYEGCNYNLRGSTVVFEDVIITTDNKTYTGYAGCKAIYNNCVINNSITLYDDSEFNNCTFNISGDQYNIWTWSAPNATFNRCTFNSDGKAILLYGGANTKLTLNACTFNDNGGLEDKKAAVEIGNDYGMSYTLIVNDTVVNGYEINDKGINTGSTLWGNKNSMGTDKLNVVVDGVDIY